MSYDEELITGFIEETRDILDDVEPTLIDLSGSNTENVDSETINAVFRLFHSLKSSAAFLGFSNVASLTHDAENVLQAVRDGSLDLTLELINVLIKCIDIIRNLLEKIEQSQEDSGFEDVISSSKVELQEFLKKKDSTPTTNNDEDKSEVEVEESIVEEESPKEVDEILITDDMRSNFVAEAIEQIQSIEQSFLKLEKGGMDSEIMHSAYRDMHSFKGNCGFMHYNDLQEISHMLETVMGSMKDGKTKVEKETITFMLQTIDTLRETINVMADGGEPTIPMIAAYRDLIKEVFPECFSSKSATIVSQEKVPTAKVKEPEEITKAEVEVESKPILQENKAPKKKRKAIVRQDIRVELSKLDTIINLVGELVISESMVTRNPAVKDIDDERFYRATHQLRRICNELQDASMSLRMVPLDGLFKKMIRVVHDLSQKIDKDIELEIIGGDTEVDKTVIEQVSDPLVHIIRNSCDHGIEPKEDRKKSGKDLTGKITIEGRHEGGEVWIIVKDDGQGLNRDKIVSKAIENGIIKEDDNLTDDEVWHLIFHPGFSTAEKITNVSGRGVGMDVVKKNIEKLNGRIDIKNHEGLGATMIIRIPLTLAIIDGMLIKVGESNYTVPTLSIKRSLRCTDDIVTHSPEGGEILRLDDKFIPIVRLGKLFGHENAYNDLKEGIIIVVDNGHGSLIALFADEIIGQQQTVIKGLSQYINNARGTSGCTILGDGSVALILDIRSLVAMAEEKTHA